MIQVEKMNGEAIFINPDLLRIMELTPDTVLTFSDNSKLIVKTKPQEIIDRIVELRKRYSMPHLRVVKED